MGKSLLCDDETIADIDAMEEEAKDNDKVAAGDPGKDSGLFTCNECNLCFSSLAKCSRHLIKHNKTAESMQPSRRPTTPSSLATPVCGTANTNGGKHTRPTPP